MVRPSRPEARSELSGRLLRQPARHWIHVLIASSEACGNDPTLRRSDTATIRPSTSTSASASASGLAWRHVAYKARAALSGRRSKRPLPRDCHGTYYEPGASDTDEEDSVSLRMLPTDRIAYATPAMIIPKIQLKSAPCVAFEIGPVYDGT